MAPAQIGSLSREEALLPVPRCNSGDKIATLLIDRRTVRNLSSIEKKDVVCLHSHVRQLLECAKLRAHVEFPRCPSDVGVALTCLVAEIVSNLKDR